MAGKHKLQAQTRLIHNDSILNTVFVVQNHKYKEIR